MVIVVSAASEGENEFSLIVSSTAGDVEKFSTLLIAKNFSFCYYKKIPRSTGSLAKTT